MRSLLALAIAAALAGCSQPTSTAPTQQPAATEQTMSSPATDTSTPPPASEATPSQPAPTEEAPANGPNTSPTDGVPPPPSEGGAQAAEMPKDLDKAHAESERLLAEIKAKIGTASCEADSDCATLPIGHKACGGPTSYLVYSTKTAKADELEALARQQKDAARSAIPEGMVSNCMMEMPPKAVCQAKMCVAAKPEGLRE